MNSKIGIAVIGCGNIARAHLDSIKQIEKARLICVYSRSEERARKTAETYSCEWSTDLKEILARNDVDLVIVITSSGSHASITKMALEADKHVLVEKPLTITTNDAIQITHLAKQKGNVLSVVSQRRFEPLVQATKLALDNQQLGKILLIEARTPYFRTQAYYDSAPWRGTYAEDGGALMNQGIHEIDLLLWFGGKVKTVFGKTATQTHNMEAEDLGLAMIGFESGAFGTIMSSTSIQPGFDGSIDIYGEKGTIGLIGNKLKHWHVPNIPEPKFDQPISIGSGASDPMGISIDNHKKQIENVIDAIVHHTEPLISGEDGRANIQVINAIYESSKKRKEITLS